MWDCVDQGGKLASLPPSTPFISSHVEAGICVSLSRTFSLPHLASQDHAFFFPTYGEHAFLVGPALLVCSPLLLYVLDSEYTLLSNALYSFHQSRSLEMAP